MNLKELNERIEKMDFVLKEIVKEQSNYLLFKARFENLSHSVNERINKLSNEQIRLRIMEVIGQGHQFSERLFLVLDSILKATNGSDRYGNIDPLFPDHPGFVVLTKKDFDSLNAEIVRSRKKLSFVVKKIEAFESRSLVAKKIKKKRHSSKRLQ